WVDRVLLAIAAVAFLDVFASFLGSPRGNPFEAFVERPLGATLLFLLLVVGTIGRYVLSYYFWRQTEGGLCPAWRQAADDPRYGKIAPPSVAGWLHGEGALGVSSSIDMKAAAVRAVWDEREDLWPQANGIVYVD